MVYGYNILLELYVIVSNEMAFLWFILISYVHLLKKILGIQSFGKNECKSHYTKTLVIHEKYVYLSFSVTVIAIYAGFS